MVRSRIYLEDLSGVKAEPGRCLQLASLRRLAVDKGDEVITTPAIGYLTRGYWMLPKSAIFHSISVFGITNFAENMKITWWNSRLHKPNRTGLSLDSRALCALSAKLLSESVLISGCNMQVFLLSAFSDLLSTPRHNLHLLLYVIPGCMTVSVLLCLPDRDTFLSKISA